jgi:hypothetical protein
VSFQLDVPGVDCLLARDNRVFQNRLDWPRILGTALAAQRNVIRREKK